MDHKEVSAVILLLLLAVADNQHVCKPGPVDVLFVFSSNHSITRPQFDAKVKIVEEYVRLVDIGPRAVRVGLASEYEYVDVEFHLDDHMDQTEILTALPFIYFSRSSVPNVGSAFTHINQQGMDTGLGGRPSAPDVVIFLTDSSTKGNVIAENSSQQIQTAHNTTVIGLGVGGVDPQDLVNVASGCHYVAAAPPPPFSQSQHNITTRLAAQAVSLTCDALAKVPAEQCCQLPTCCPRNVDLVWLLDASSLQTKQGFKKQLAYVANVTQALRVSGNGSRVAVVNYSTHAHPQFAFDAHLDKDVLLHAIEFVPYQYGTRHVEEGLKFIAEHAVLQGGRAGVDTVLVVTTTGPQQGAQADIQRYVHQLQSAGVRLVSLGVGGAVIDAEVTLMGGARHARVYRDADALMAGWQDGVRLVCEAGNSR